MVDDSCNSAFEWCPVDSSSVPGIQTTQMELTSSILVICFNAIEFIFNSIYWGVVIVPVLAATP